MKLPSYQLERHLQDKILAPIYVISGDEILLKQEASLLIRNAAKKAGFTEYTRLFMETVADWETLFHTAYSISLFSSQRLLEVEASETTIPQAVGKILETYTQNPPQGAVLLLHLGKLEKKIEKSTWFQALEKIGVVIPIWPPFRDALPQWIIQRAKQHQLTLTKTAIHLLADSTEGNLLATAQTIEKLALLQLPNPIDDSAVAMLLTDEAQFSIFDFAEQLLENPSRALRILEALRVEGVEPTLVLWAITRELRMLVTATREQRTHLFPSRRQPGVQRLLQKYSERDYLKRFLAAAQIDRIIKGATPGDPWVAFAQLVVC